MTRQELKEQLQEDLIAHLEGAISQQGIDKLCDVVIKRVNQLEKSYTERDLMKAHEWGSEYMRGSIGKAQDWTFSELLKSLAK